MSEALYYPYTNIRSIDSLKSMILYFDKISVINPIESSIGRSQDKRSEIDELERNGVIKLISPSRLLEKYDEIMTQSVMCDLTDSKFLTMCQKENKQMWEIYAEKVPAGVADASFRKYLVNFPNFYEGHAAKHELREGPFASSISGHHEFYEEMSEMREERVARYREYRRVFMPFPVGESIMINHALCAADCFKLTPITDDPVHHDFLMSKFSRLCDSKLWKRILKDYRFIKDVKNDLTAVNVISDTVPALKGASVTDVLEFRDENKDSLKSFRTEIGRLATEVETNFWDIDFQKEIIDFVDAKVKPSIEVLRASAESAKDKLARLFKRGVTIAPLSLVASVAPGCDSGVALIASAGVFALGEYLEHQKTKRTKRKNGFAYLFDAQKKLGNSSNNSQN